MNSPNKKFTDEQYLELYNKDLNDREISEIFKVSDTTIRYRRYKLNLLPKNIRYDSIPEFQYKNLLLKNIENSIKYRLKNHEKVINNGRKYYNSHKEKIKIYSKNYYKLKIKG